MLSRNKKILIAVISALLSGCGLFLTGILPALQKATTHQNQVLTNESTSFISTSTLTSLVDFEALLSTNPDTVGWLSVPDTTIDYPVVQSDNNETYLRTDFEGNENISGCVFLDASYNSSRSPKPQNSVLYGHSVKNGEGLFNDLHYYLDENFYNAHRIIRYDRPNDPAEWEIFAVLEVAPTYDYRRPDFKNSEDFLNYFNKIQAESLYKTEDTIKIQSTDEILTLSTCSFNMDNGRLIILAHRIYP